MLFVILLLLMVTGVSADEAPTGYTEEQALIVTVVITVLLLVLTYVVFRTTRLKR